MKKMFAVGLALTAAMALAACGSTKTTTVTSTVQPTSTQASSTTNTTTTAQPVVGPVNKTCSVTSVPNVSPTTVPVQLVAKGYPANKAALVNCATASFLVNLVAKQRAEEPVNSNNFTCVPAVTGTKAAFVCSGANDTIKYRFTLNYTLTG
jgi:hypothetical protein